MSKILVGENLYVVTLRPRGPLSDDELAAQRAFLKQLSDEERLVLAGRFSDGAGEGAAILRASNLDDARTLYAKSPVAIAAKADWQVREWRVTAVGM